MNDPKLYFECADRLPLWTFCYSAVIGAKQNCVPTHPFESLSDLERIRHRDGNIVVGSVESISHYLKVNGFEVPTSIDEGLTDNSDYLELLGREVEVLDYSDLKSKGFETPFFMKPHGTIKSFSGFVVRDQKTFDEMDSWTYHYSGLVQKQSLLDQLHSEWRIYMLDGNPIGMCNYKGNPLITPSTSFLLKVMGKNLIEGVSSYSIDVGVTDDGEFLIEFNDGWGLENYGLSPEKYFQFVKSRFEQMTKI